MITLSWLHAYVLSQRSSSSQRGSRLRHDAGEGVISAAIAVLVMALLGAAMWVAFNRIWTDAAGRTESKVTQISD